MREKLDTEAIQRGLETSLIGKKIHAFSIVGSTNETAKRLAENGAPEGSIIIAEEQRSGRGRHGRSWHSPKGGLWFSIILSPDLPSQRVPLLSLVSALSVEKGSGRLRLSSLRFAGPMMS